MSWINYSCTFDCRYVAVTGIINEDIQATKGLNRGTDGAVGLLSFVTSTETIRYTLSELASDLDELFRIAGRGHNAVSGLGGLFAKRSAKAAGSSGN